MTTTTSVFVLSFNQPHFCSYSRVNWFWQK